MVALNHDPQDTHEQRCERTFYALHNAQYNVMGLVGDSEKYEGPDPSVDLTGKEVHFYSTDNSKRVNFMPYFSIIIAALVGLVGCGDAPSHHFIVPVDFRGVFKVVPFEKAGVTPVNSDGVYIYDIPEGGVLAIIDTSIFAEWTDSITAEFSDGSVLATPVQAELPPYEDKIGLHVMSADSEGIYYFLIGTGRELAGKFKTHDYQLGGIVK